MSLDSQDQILHWSILRIRQAAAFARPHLHSEFRFRAVHLGPFGDAPAAGSSSHHFLITAQQLDYQGKVMHIGSREGDREIAQTTEETPRTVIPYSSSI